jgi:type IV secretion system protein VirB6
MKSLSYNNFIVNLAGEIDRLTNHFIFDGYNALAALLKAPIGASIVLYIVLMGYAIARGIVQRPQDELFKFAIRAGLIYMTALNWGFFSAHIKDLFVVGSESIANTLMKAVHHQTAGGSIYKGLQDVFNEVLKLGCHLFEAGSFRKLMPYFAGIMVFLSGCITVGIAFFEILIAKLMLALTLCTAPLFILFTLFEQTKSFFERWLGILVGFSLVLVFVSSVVGLCVHLLHWVTFAMLSNPTELKAAVWVPLFMVAALCVMGITQATNIGKSIGGALCTSGATAFAALEALNKLCKPPCKRRAIP